LQDNGRDVRLGSRAIELLTALVERGGEVVANNELIARVWPTTTVEEHNLRVQIAGLRKALADGHGDERFIATSPGRGYRFVAPVLAGALAQSHEDAAAEVRGNLPASLIQLFGRTEVLDDLRRGLSNQRLVTIVGPGGVGKTSVAVATAHEVAVDGAWFVDLAPVSDPVLARTALLETFGLAASPDNLPAALAHRLEGQSALMVLDNCEHLIKDCASLAEELLAAVKGLRILATSREALHAAGEWVLRLPALETPDGEASLEIASSCSAVQLFVQRAASTGDRFSLTEETLPPVIDICRRLDGMPLALELAAATVSTLGLRGVAHRLREQLELPGVGRRTAAARQATLRATLDWSYRLLSPSEQQALRRMAVFQGAFTLESAAALVGSSAAHGASVLELIASLAEKSLLSVDLSREAARYRILQTTRAFALDRLTPREAAATRARHARELRRLAEATDAAWGAGDGVQARRDSADLIDDLNLAIEWALSSLGDLDTAVEVIVAAAPLRRRLSLMREHRVQVERALDLVRALSPPNPAAEMRLLGSYGLATTYSYATSNTNIAAADRLLALALELGDTEHLMIGLWDRMVPALMLGDMATQRRCTDQMVAAVSLRPDDAYQAIAHHMRHIIAMADGDFALAGHESEAGLRLMVDAPGNLHIARLGVDPGAQLYEGLATRLWVQGFPAQALAAARACISRCRQLSHALSLIFALADVAASAALLVGDVEAAEAFLQEHRRLCDERGERGYTARSQEFMQAVLRVTRTGLADEAAAALVAPGSTHPLLSRPHLAIRIAEAVGHSKSPEDGLAALETIRAFVRGGDSGWMGPELLRVRALMLSKAGTATTPEVEAMLRQGQRQANQMGTLALELRTVTALAEVLSVEGRSHEALELLTDVMNRVAEGRDATDYQRAVSLRNTLLGR
jgi:predicted ATPase/DNA-binding winged helix-turn-helix (wHTH) protein